MSCERRCRVCSSDLISCALRVEEAISELLERGKSYQDAVSATAIDYQSYVDRKDS